MQPFTSDIKHQQFSVSKSCFYARLFYVWKNYAPAQKNTRTFNNGENIRFVL